MLSTNRYNKSDYSEMNVSEKLSTVAGLCMAKEEELTEVRSFICSSMGKEMLATYDSLWIRNDAERAQIIAENELHFEEGESCVL